MALLRTTQWVLAIPAGLIVAFLIVVFSPLRRFRFYVLPVDEIGPLILYPHLYLWGLGCTPVPQNVHDVFVYRPDTFISNQLLIDKWSKIIRVSRSRTLWIAQSIFVRLRLHRHLVRNGIDRSANIACFPSRSFEYLVPLDSAEQAQAIATLKQLGMDTERDFVPIIVRDDVYKQNYRRTPLPVDIKENYRNQQIEDFALCAAVAEQNNVSLVRMGVLVRDPFPVESPLAFDYAKSGLRDEVTDLYLLTNGVLVISSSLGADSVSGIAGIARLVVNVVPFFPLVNSYEWDVVIPVRFRNRGSGTELSLCESLMHPAIRQFRGSEELDRAGLEIVRATPSEMAEVFGESLQRCKGNLTLSERDLEMQARFWTLVESAIDLSGLEGLKRPLVSPAYLQRHQDWLFGSGYVDPPATKSS